MKHNFFAKHILIFLLSFLVYSGCSTTPRLFQDDAYLQSTEKCYKITFLAYGAGTLLAEGEKSITGHASLSIERNGVWGFYPSTPGKILAAHGVLKYSSEYPITQEYADFFVDEKTMNKISALIVGWEKDPPFFSIPFNDCVSFIYRVCDTIGLRYNRFILFPADAICEIRNLNDQYHIYRDKGELNEIQNNSPNLKHLEEATE
jgi:hypothetical protein